MLGLLEHFGGFLPPTFQSIDVVGSGAQLVEFCGPVLFRIEDKPCSFRVVRKGCPCVGGLAVLRQSWMRLMVCMTASAQAVWEAGFPHIVHLDFCWCYCAVFS